MANNNSTHGRIKSVPAGLSTINQSELKMVGNFRQLDDKAQAYILGMMKFFREEFPLSVPLTPTKLRLIQGSAA